MSQRPHHPSPLSDALLLAYIEEELDARTLDAVERTLREDPILDRRVRGMRLDRAVLLDALGMINDERAPRDLIASVLETVERTALLSSIPASALSSVSPPVNNHSERSIEVRTATSQELLDVAEVSDRDDFSRLPHAPPAIARSRHPAAWRLVSSRPLAAAAGFALLVGAAALVASVMTAKDSRGVLSRGDADLARSSPSAPDLAAGKSLRESVELAMADKAGSHAEAGVSETHASSPVGVASAADQSPQLNRTADHPTVASSPGTANSSGIATAGDTEPGNTEPGNAGPALSGTSPITTERAAQLAAENRLAIRVVPRRLSDPAKLSAGLAALTKHDAARSWKLNSRPSPEFASSVVAQLDAKAPRATTSLVIAGKDRTRRDDNPLDPTGDLERALGSQSDPVSRTGFNAAEGTPNLRLSTPEQPGLASQIGHGPTAQVEMYQAEIAASPSALASLRSTLDRAGNVEIVFEELAAPVTLAPALTEQNILWWTQPSSAWVRRTTVPIIVETGT